MTHCGEYHNHGVSNKSLKRIRNFAGVTNVHTLFKHLDDEMVT